MRVFVAGRGRGRWAALTLDERARLGKLIHKMAPPAIYDATCHAEEVTGFPSTAAAPSVG